MRPLTRAFAAAYLAADRWLSQVTLLVLIWVGPVAAADTVPSGAKKALAPVTKMIGTLVAIAIGLGIAICGGVIVWGGIEKTLAGGKRRRRASRPAAHRERDPGAGLDDPGRRHRGHDHRDRRRVRAHRATLLSRRRRWRRSRRPHFPDRSSLSPLASAHRAASARPGRPGGPRRPPVVATVLGLRSRRRSLKIRGPARDRRLRSTTGVICRSSAIRSAT